jgi:hypothetical protein
MVENRIGEMYSAPTANAALLPSLRFRSMRKLQITEKGETNMIKSVISDITQSLMKIVLVLRHLPGILGFQNFSTGLHIKILTSVIAT